MMRNKIPALAVVLALVLAGAGSLLAVDAGRPARPSAPILASAGTVGTPTPTPTTSTTEHHRRPTDSLPATAAGDVPAGDESDDRPIGRSDAADDAEVTPNGPVHDVMPGAGSTPPTKPVDPIGDLDDQRPVPAGFDVTAPPQQTPSPGDHGGPSDLAVEPSCSHQCISRGVAYPRGFGAELIVETTVPARLFISVVADLDANGTYEDHAVESTPFDVTEHTWALDHLEPGQTYHVMAAATDEDGHTAYVWGAFTTLSKRDVFVAFGEGEVVGGPDDISATRWHLGLDGPLADVTPGEQGILLHQDLPRQVDVDFWVLRIWDDHLCEAWGFAGAPPQGHDAGSCLTWNSTQLDGVDLDTIPAGVDHWTETSVAVSLHSPTGAGDALPPGYGDPYYFSFEVPMTMHVTYS